MAVEQVVLDIIAKLQNAGEIEKLESQISLLQQKFRELGKAYTGTPGFAADAQNLQEMLGRLDTLQNAHKATADAAKQAARDAADAQRQAARDAADAARQAARDARDAAQGAANAQKQAARDVRDAARQAARDAADAQRQVARDARDAAAAQKQAARDAADVQKQAARDAADAARASSKQQIADAKAVADAQKKAARAADDAADAARKRSGAKFQVGLAAANIAQDAIQGGPASTINNFLGLAGNGTARAMAGEALAAVGGFKVLAATLGTVAIAAGAAFLVIDNGLDNAKLKWSDLDDVIGNLAPINAVGEAFAGLGQAAEQSGLTTAITTAWEKLETFAGDIAQATIGWRDATEAVKLHNEELARGVQAAQEYAEAVKELKSVRSDEQKKADDTGKLVGKEIADLGGAGGVDAVADKLSGMMAAFGGKNKVKVQEIGKDDKGKDVIKEVEITQREKVRRDIIAEIGRANGGDTSALNRLMPLLKRAGYDTGDLGMAARGIDPKKEAEEEKKAQEHFDKEHQEGEERAAKAQAKAVEDRIKAEKEEEKQERLAQEHFDREHQKGEDNFAKWQAEQTKKRQDEDMDAQLKDRMGKWRDKWDDDRKGSQVFNDASSLRDAIQSAVKGPDKDPTQEQMLDVQRSIEAELKKANEMKQGQGFARLG